MKRRMRAPSPAFAISLIALFLALGGTSFAASKVMTAKHKDAKADTKLVKKLAPKLSVKHAKTANSAANATHATSADSATNATHATSADSATNATHATSATNATTAANANALGGIAASGYTRRDCSSLTGQIKGFARINDAAVSTTTLSTAGVEAPYNCSGGSVLARRISTGKYEVQFVGGPAAIAFATPESADGSSTFDVDSASVNRIGSGHFYVQLWNDPLSNFINGSFSIWTP